MIGSREIRRFASVLGCLVSVASGVSSKTTLISSAGDVVRSQETSSLTVPSGGVVSVLINPSSPYFPTVGDVSASAFDDVLAISCPGASFRSSDAPSELERGCGGIPAVSSLSKCVVLTGVRENDCGGDHGIGGSRHGRSLGLLFGGRLACDFEDKVSLIVAIEGNVTEEDRAKLTEDIRVIFDVEWLDCGRDGESTLEDFYDLEIVAVETEQDAQKVLQMAKSVAPIPSMANRPVLSLLSSSFKPTSAASRNNLHEPITLTASMLTCEDSYARLSKSFFSKILSWNYRVNKRNLTIDKFGSNAESLLKRTLDAYDKATLSACGVASAERMRLRDKLVRKMTPPVESLFAAQTALLSRSAERRFRRALLRRLDAQRAPESPSAAAPDDGDVGPLLRNAVFAFDTAASDLEVPSLSLFKKRAVASMRETLQNALVDFPDSPAAKLLMRSKVEKRVSNRNEPKPKQKSKPKSLDVGLGLVAMIRPDGFGNLQGFTGYSIGSNTITVGLHNDADAPETIAQFGGVRPPFLRIQPKLNLDVEL